MPVIAVYPEAVPIEILNVAMLTASRKADWVEIMIGLLVKGPAQKLTELGPDVRFVYCYSVSVVGQNEIQYKMILT